MDYVFNAPLINWPWTMMVIDLHGNLRYIELYLLHALPSGVLAGWWLWAAQSHGEEMYNIKSLGYYV